MPGLTGHAIPLNAANGPITAYSAYQTATAPGSWAATDNVSLAGNPSAATGTQTINSLRLTGASAVQIGSGNTLTLASGGLLVTGSGATSIAPDSGTATLTGASGSRFDRDSKQQCRFDD